MTSLCRPKSFFSIMICIIGFPRSMRNTSRNALILYMDKTMLISVPPIRTYTALSKRTDSPGKTSPGIQCLLSLSNLQDRRFPDDLPPDAGPHDFSFTALSIRSVSLRPVKAVRIIRIQRSSGCWQAQRSCAQHSRRSLPSRSDLWSS